MKKLVIGLSMMSLLVAGCTAVKEWSPTGGSRSDGVVRLSYDYGMFEKPVLNNSQGLELARERCATWGYNGAEPFGGQTQQCTQWSGSGCMRWQVTKEFQCTGTGTPIGPVAH